MIWSGCNPIHNLPHSRWAQRQLRHQWFSSSPSVSILGLKFNNKWQYTIVLQSIRLKIVVSNIRSMILSSDLDAESKRPKSKTNKHVYWTILVDLVLLTKYLHTQSTHIIWLTASRSVVTTLLKNGRFIKQVTLGKNLEHTLLPNGSKLHVSNLEFLMSAKSNKLKICCYLSLIVKNK